MCLLLEMRLMKKVALLSWVWILLEVQLTLDSILPHSKALLESEVVGVEAGHTKHLTLTPG